MSCRSMRENLPAKTSQSEALQVLVINPLTQKKISSEDQVEYPSAPD